MRPKLILGGPGCGKTTALLEVIEKAFDRGVEPHQIAFVAFTRKAAQEARDRMVTKFGIERDAMPYFRTLHSLAFHQIDAERSQILDREKILAYAKAEGLALKAEFIDEFGQVAREPFTPDELAFSCYSLSRLTERPLQDILYETDLLYDYAKKVVSDYVEFKEQAFLLDFTDMIEKFIREGSAPFFELLIVDEAQDLSRLQWEMVDKLGENARRIYYAGDDDQAIFSWAGADIERFLSMDADREVLPTSYRLQSNVFDQCQKVLRLVDERYSKDWQPHKQGGSVEYVTWIDNLDMSEGTWFVLARTNSLVRRLTEHVRHEGFAYWSPTADGMVASTSVPSVQAVLVYENLRQGKQFSGDKLRAVWECLRSTVRPETAPVFEETETYDLDYLCSTGLDASKSWLDVLSIGSGMTAYIRAMRARGESLIDPPRITVSTIHGVKGGEAGNVVVWQKLTSQTRASWIDGDPHEYRTLFTAMSRAKDRLIFLGTTSRTNYGIEDLLI